MRSAFLEFSASEYSSFSRAAKGSEFFFGFAFLQGSVFTDFGFVFSWM